MFYYNLSKLLYSSLGPAEEFIQFFMKANVQIILLNVHSVPILSCSLHIFTHRAFRVMFSIPLKHAKTSASIGH